MAVAVAAAAHDRDEDLMERKRELKAEQRREMGKKSRGR